MKPVRSILYFVTIAMLVINTAHGADCNDALYRYTNPTECKSWNATGTILLGAAAAIGGGALLFGTTSQSHGTTPPPMPTVNTYNYSLVGADVDSTHLAGIMGNADYAKNTTQFNDIRAAYSIARGFTGHGSEIAILDTGPDTWHGHNVAYIAGNTIVPDATVTSYKITDTNGHFMTYGQIGDVIASAQTANIYNASWSVANMSAAAIHSRAQVIRLTDEKFVNSLSGAATDRDAIFVWAAGNDGHTESSALSALPHVIPELNGHFVNVVAWDTENQTLADYSNMCGVTRDWCITAPGDINTDTGQTFGTSFAAPAVSAAIAVLRDAFPYMTAPQITALLFESARDLGAPGVDDVYGHGMLDLEHATRPQGAALVPINDVTTTAPMRTARISGAMGHNIRKMDLQLAYLDSYGRPFQARLNDNISIKNPGRAFERLRTQDTPSAKIGNIEFGLRNTDLLFGGGFMGTAPQTQVGFIATNHTHKIGNIELSTRTQFATAMPDAPDNSLITDFSTVHMASINIGANMGDWHISFGIPDTIISGNMNLHLPTDRGRDGHILYQDYDIDLVMRPATEYTVGYRNITATFIDNPYGTDEFFVMTRGRISF